MEINFQSTTFLDVFTFFSCYNIQHNINKGNESKKFPINLIPTYMIGEVNECTPHNAKIYTESMKEEENISTAVKGSNL